MLVDVVNRGEKVPRGESDPRRFHLFSLSFSSLTRSQYQAYRFRRSSLYMAACLALSFLFFSCLVCLVLSCLALCCFVFSCVVLCWVVLSCHGLSLRKNLSTLSSFIARPIRCDTGNAKPARGVIVVSGY